MIIILPYWVVECKLLSKIGVVRFYAHHLFLLDGKNVGEDAEQRDTETRSGESVSLTLLDCTIGVSGVEVETSGVIVHCENTAVLGVDTLFHCLAGSVVSVLLAVHHAVSVSVLLEVPYQSNTTTNDSRNQDDTNNDCLSVDDTTTALLEVGVVEGGEAVHFSPCLGWDSF